MPKIDREFEAATGVRRIKFEDMQWFENEKRRMQEKHSQAAAAMEQESRSRFLLESFERVFVKTLKLQVGQLADQQASFDHLVDNSLRTARKAVEQMKQLDSDLTTVLKSPTVSVQVEASRPTAEQIANKPPVDKRTGKKKPPASDR